MRRRHRSAHRTIWILLAVVVPLVLALGWSQRPTHLSEPAAIELPRAGGTR